MGGCSAEVDYCHRRDGSVLTSRRHSLGVRSGVAIRGKGQIELMNGAWTVARLIYEKALPDQVEGWGQGRDAESASSKSSNIQKPDQQPRQTSFEDGKLDTACQLRRSQSAEQCSDPSGIKRLIGFLPVSCCHGLSASVRGRKRTAAPDADTLLSLQRVASGDRR